MFDNVGVGCDILSVYRIFTYTENIKGRKNEKNKKYFQENSNGFMCVCAVCANGIWISCL